MTRHKLRPPAPALTEPAMGAWAAKVKPKPAPTETRVERQKRMETTLAHDHYDQLIEGESDYHRGIFPPACPECRAHVSWFVYRLSAPYHAAPKIRWGTR